MGSFARSRRARIAAHEGDGRALLIAARLVAERDDRAIILAGREQHGADAREIALYHLLSGGTPFGERVEAAPQGPVTAAAELQDQRCQGLGAPAQRGWLDVKDHA